MDLNVIESNNNKIYNLTDNKTFSEYLQLHKNNIKTLKKDISFQNRLELIQDFNFPTACSKIKITKDQNNIIASGVYKPTLKIFENNQLSLKCARGLDSEIIDFSLLTEDYKKIAIVCADRNIEIHAQYGKHFKTRVPKTPRCCLFNEFSCEFLIGASSEEVYRLNLEEGRFMNSVSVCESGVNSMVYNKFLDVAVFGCDNGVVEVCDYRERKCVGQIKVGDEDVMVVENSGNGYEFLVGGSEGIVRIYDLRYDKFVQEIRHPYMMPIISIQFCEKSNMLVSADKKQVRIYDKNNFEENFLNFEPKKELNDLKIFPGSGLLIAGAEDPKCQAFYIPALGHAPKFCEFIENFTEELEDKSRTMVLEEFKFVSYKELVQLKATHLIGGKKIKAHLHGFMMKSKLYDILKSQEEGFDYNKYKEDKIQEAIDKKIKESIYIKEDRIKINKKIYKIEDLKKKKKKDDDRFSLNKKDFEIDSNHPMYRLRNHTNNNRSKKL